MVSLRRLNVVVAWSAILWSMVWTPSTRIVASAQPVSSNDNCTGAILLTVNGPSVAGNLSLATQDVSQVPPDDVIATRGNGCSGTEVNSNAPGLWYRFAGTGGPVWVNTCFPNNVNPLVSIYKGACGSTLLQCVVGKQTPCSSNVQEKVTLATEIGVTYHVLVRSATLATNRAIQVQASTFTPPPNDVCATAAPISVGSSVTGNISFAYSDELEVLDKKSCFRTTGFVLNDDDPGLWYTFGGTGSRVWVTTCFSNSIATDVSVYQGSSCGPANLQCVAGQFSLCSGGSDKLTLDTLVGTTYYMLVRSAVKSDDRTFEVLVTNIRAVPSVYNDLCVNAAPLSIGSTVVGNLTLATTDEGDVPGDCLAGQPFDDRPGLWYTFDGNGANVTVDACSQDSVKTHLSVYKGNACGKTTLQCVIGTYDSCTLPKFTIPTIAGTKYYLNVRSATPLVPNPKVFDVKVYMEGMGTNAPTTPTVPTAPKAPTPTVPTPPTPMAPTPVASTPMAPAPVASIPSAPAPVASIPMAPTPPLSPSAPTGSESCGWLGLSLFCPLTRCGLIGRLLKLCQK